MNKIFGLSGKNEYPNTNPIPTHAPRATRSKSKQKDYKLWKLLFHAPGKSTDQYYFTPPPTHPQPTSRQIPSSLFSHNAAHQKGKKHQHIFNQDIRR
jgi:hypothetical protein